MGLCEKVKTVLCRHTGRMYKDRQVYKAVVKGKYLEFIMR